MCCYEFECFDYLIIIKRIHCCTCNDLQYKLYNSNLNYNEKLDKFRKFCWKYRRLTLI